MKERCLPHLQGHTCPVLPSGVCSSLYPRPVIFHLQKPSFLLLCYLQDTTLSLFSPVTPDILWGPGLAVGTASPLQQKNACGSSTPALSFLLPVGKWGSGSGCWLQMHGCIPSQGCCCLFPVGASSEHVVCTKFHLVVTMRTGSSSRKPPPPLLPYIGFFCPLPFQSAWEVLLTWGRNHIHETLKIHTGGVLPSLELCCSPNHCLKPPSPCTLARTPAACTHGCVMGSALSPCPAFLSPTSSPSPLAVSPCLNGLWEENGLSSNSDKFMQPIFPQNRLVISRVPTGKGCRPITQTLPSATLLWVAPGWGMCWQLNSKEPWPCFV